MEDHKKPIRVRRICSSPWIISALCFSLLPLECAEWKTKWHNKWHSVACWFLAAICTVNHQQLSWSESLAVSVGRDKHTQAKMRARFLRGRMPNKTEMEWYRQHRWWMNHSPCYKRNMGHLLCKNHLHTLVLPSEFVSCLASQKMNGKCFKVSGIFVRVVYVSVLISHNSYYNEQKFGVS